MAYEPKERQAWTPAVAAARIRGTCCHREDSTLLPTSCRPGKCRRGAATLDYVLLLCVCLPMAAFALWAGPRIMNLVYQMTRMLISWPFL